MERKIPRKRVAHAVGLTCRDGPESSQVAAGCLRGPVSERGRLSNWRSGSGCSMARGSELMGNKRKGSARGRRWALSKGAFRGGLEGRGPPAGPRL